VASAPHGDGHPGLGHPAGQGLQIVVGQQVARAVELDDEGLDAVVLGRVDGVPQEVGHDRVEVARDLDHVDDA
jgi:hypothetical protein